MEGLTWGHVIALLGVCVSVCSLVSFYAGRKKAAVDDAKKAVKEDTRMSLDLQYIKDSVRDTTKALEKLADKMDKGNEAREKQYREILVEFTKLKSSYDALHKRVDDLTDEVARYHHN